MYALIKKKFEKFVVYNLQAYNEIIGKIGYLTVMGKKYICVPKEFAQKLGDFFGTDYEDIKVLLTKHGINIDENKRGTYLIDQNLEAKIDKIVKKHIGSLISDLPEIETIQFIPFDENGKVQTEIDIPGEVFEAQTRILKTLNEKEIKEALNDLMVQ